MVEIKNLKGEVVYTYEGAYLWGAYLQGTDLRGANLQDADLWGANLQGANLQGANLQGADLQGASLQGTDLRYADLWGANLRGAKGILQWQSPLGFKRICYSVLHENNVMHQLGCFWGGTQEAQSAIIEKYGEDSLYEEYLLLADKALRAEGKKDD